MGGRGYLCAAAGPLRLTVTVAAAVTLAAAAVTLGGVAAGASGPPPASGHGPLGAAKELIAGRAAQLATASARAAALTATAAALRSRAEVLTEDYDHEAVLAKQAAAGYQVAAVRLAAARRTEKLASVRLARQAAADYEADGGPEMTAVMLAGTMLAGPAGMGQYLGVLGAQQVMAGQRADLVAASQADSAVTGLFAAQAASLLARQRAATGSADDLRLAVTAAVSHQAGVLRQATAAQATLAAELATARASATVKPATVKTATVNPATGTGSAGGSADAGRAAALPPAVAAGGPPGAAPGVTWPAWSLDAGASPAAGETAARWALTQLGRPYQWGAAGPGRYDCSGLAMAAWARAGVTLDHWTGFQWVSGPHVPLGQLRVGDLVFYATNVADPATIHHVGIYLGAGRMVDAPYTGAAVRIDSIYAYPGLIGMTRPAAPDG